MFKSILSYWELISPGRIIFSAICIAAVAFTITILILFLLRKKILIKRRLKIFKILSISYFIILPLLAAFFGFKYGIVNGVHHSIKKQLPQYTRILDTLVARQVGIDLRKGSSAYRSDAPGFFSPAKYIDTLSEIIYSGYAATLITEAATKGYTTRAAMATVLLKSLSVTHISAAIKKAIGKLLRLYFKAEDNDDELKDIDVQINKLLEGGFVTEIINTQVDDFFNGIKKGILILGAIILFLPLTEIIIANILYRKYNKLNIINMNTTDAALRKRRDGLG